MSRDVDVVIPVAGGEITATLAVPNDAEALVLFVHGGGSSRLSPRNQFVAEVLRRGGFGTFLLDLLTEDEARVDDTAERIRTDIALLAGRVIAATDWLRAEELLLSPQLGYFGSSTGAAAALVAAAKRRYTVAAVVSRGGRPDLAADVLPDVRAATLFIVGEDDHEAAAPNEAAWRALAAPHKDLRFIKGASHLFEEPGALDEAAEIAREWFEQFLLTTLRSPKSGMRLDPFGGVR